MTLERVEAMLRRGLQSTLETIHELEQRKEHGGCLWQLFQGLREEPPHTLGTERRETWVEEEEEEIWGLGTFGIHRGLGN